ncbi:DUF3772 domain-containing protein [Roseisalinus antarcticus]|uniref:Mechanosensitive channel MscK n=1 Tax=Roseisalinus antarcticus TaxID=254357 RepID=A0A1Y5TT94_9RHOB|nr:DUF3772 domain-containing protein [Roseisalinus antarcticus]SLN71887.1 Mechanosensitive channel MscK precursor [Roseisalinus antarcticus]
MIRALSVLFLVAAGLLLPAGTAVAQVDEPGSAVAPETSTYAEFDAVARRAEEAIDAGLASTLAFTSLRQELVDWRDRLSAENAIGAQRLRTLQGQLEALAPPQTADGEAQEQADPISERRAELQAELREIGAPALLASEARARATGLIAEIDSLVREREARQLSERGPLPVNPANWPTAAAAVKRGVEAFRLDVESALRGEAKLTDALSVAPAASTTTLFGLLILLRGRAWSGRLERRAMASERTGKGALAFAASLGKIALPFLGLLAIYAGLTMTGLVGLRVETMLVELPFAALYVLIAGWLVDHYFLPDGEEGPAPAEHSGGPTWRRDRVLAAGLGWTLTVSVLVRTFGEVAEAGAAATAVLMFPVHLIGGALLFGLGRRIAIRPAGAEPETGPARGLETLPEDDVAEGMPLRVRITRTVGQLAMLGGLLGPLCAILGYEEAATVMLRPIALTLALLGMVLLLQRLVFDLYALMSRRLDGGTDALAPVLVAFALTLLALPFLALIWGARVSDLTELWNRFREGVALGDTRISPTVFLSFAIVFAIGYVLTRLIQGGLRNTVLPRTRLDIGGQNAIASGVGYVGVILSAFVAITAAGINLSALGYVAGALSVGIGFGLQNIVSNFVSGIILLIERPISQGDWIEVGGQMGYVRDISVRSTRIETFDRTDVIVPNADLISGTVTNWTRGNSVGRVIVPVGVAYGTDTQKVSDILMAIAREHPMVLHNPEPAVLFRTFGADSLEFEIRAILRDVNWVMNVHTDLNHAIAKRFAEEGIEIPFAQRDIWLRNPEVLRDTGGAAASAPAASPSPAPADTPTDPDKGDLT